MIYVVMTKEKFMKENKFGLRKLNTGFAKYFIGNLICRKLICLLLIYDTYMGLKGSWFSHLAVEVPGEDTKIIWDNPVSDEKYSKLEMMI